MKHTILCVDDETDNVEALERLFRRNYKVLKATSAARALDLLDDNRVSVIISDQRMPNMSGVELLAESIHKHPDTIRILLTGYTDIESVIAAINSGHVYRYVTKPWDPVDLANAVDKAVERYELGEELREKNRALQIALDELKTLDEAKSNFMILINHELKTPLTSILSYSDILSETALHSDQSLYLSRIRSSAARLQELVNDSLELVSAETRQTQTDIRPLNTKALFTPIPDHINSLIKSRKLDLRLEIENQTVLADEKSVRNVIRRLLHNAAKFAEIGSEVHITGVTMPGPRSDSDSDSGAGKHYEIRIRNRGPAMDERKIHQILKPFTLNESILHHSTGTGMGLSVSQALLRLNQSTLDFACKDGWVEVSFKLRR